ncbi:MAG: hypothetical protein NVS4B3_21300 [Gemmatimonadaceae bacterium]
MTTHRKRGSKDPLRLQDTVRLSAAGAGMLLGDLEHRVLQAAWAAKRPATARELFERVAKVHDVVYITCVTVANRLVEKGLLRRAKEYDVYHYSATLTKAEFIQQASRHVVRRLVSLGSAAVAASLVDVLAERDPEQLAALARLVQAKLKKEGE